MTSCKFQRLKFIAAALCATTLVSVAHGELNVGDKPGFSSLTLDSRRLSLADFRGRIVIVDFWATYSSASLRELAGLKTTYEKHQDDGVVVVGVCLDDGPALAVQAVKEREIPWPSVMDINGLSDAWGVTSIPTRFIIGPDGQVVWTGYPSGTDEALEDALKKFPPKLVDAKTLAAASDALTAADVALKDKKTLVAYRALARVPAGAKADKEFRKKFADVEARVSAAGDEMLAGVDGLVGEGKYAEAAERLKDVMKTMSGTTLADKAKAQLEALNNNADAKDAVSKAGQASRLDAQLAVARKLEADKKDAQAYVKYKELAKSAPGTPQGDEALDAVKRYEADADFMKRHADASNADKAKSALSLAKSYVTAGRTDAAKRKFQEIIDQYPDTPYAQQAKSELDQLKQN